MQLHLTLSLVSVIELFTISLLKACETDSDKIDIALKPNKTISVLVIDHVSHLDREVDCHPHVEIDFN